MQVSKWGDTLAIRIPEGIAGELNLKEGDQISLSVAGPSQFMVERTMTREEAIEVIRKGGLQFPEDFKFDREEANARPSLPGH